MIRSSIGLRLHRADAYRVEVNVAREGQKVVVAFDQLGFEAAVEQVAVAAVAKVVVDRVGRRERLHEFRAVRLRGLEDQVEVVRHADEQIEPDVELLDAFGQSLQKAFVVWLVLEQPALVASRPPSGR